MSRKALIVGASGLVGSHLAEAFRPTWDVTGTYFAQEKPGLCRLDMTDADATLALIRSVRPEVVLCPAADPNVDRCEQQPAATRRINLHGTRAVVEAARAVSAKLVWFSTDYVFDGARPPYREDAPRGPLNEYARQKVACEDLVAAYPDHVIARVSAVYGWEKARKNYVVRLIERVGRGERAKAWTDQVLTPTFAPNLGVVIRELVESGATGTYHTCGSQPMDRYSFSTLICRTFDLDPSLIDPVTSDEFQPTPTPRPRDVGLLTEKIRAVVRTPLASPAEGLARMKATGDHHACAS